MLRKLSLALIRFALIAAIAAGMILGTSARASADTPVIYYVKNGPSGGAYDGLSWDRAFPDLVSALGSIPSGSPAQIWVAAGTYLPASAGLRNISFDLHSGLEIYGGFNGTETALSQRNIALNVTVLSGDIGAPGDSSDNSYHVVNSNGAGSTAVLDGFTITGGNATALGSSDTEEGGGIYNVGSSPTFRNLIIVANQALFGGGMYSAGSNATLTNVRFTSNTAFNQAGGMYNDAGSTPILNNVTFDLNSAVHFGGAMYNYSTAAPSLGNASFLNNYAVNGGAVYNDGSAPTFTNVSFTANWATNNGGAMNNVLSAAPVLNGVTFFANQASSAGAGIYTNNSNPALTNVTFYGNRSASGGGMYTDNSASLYVVLLKNITFSANVGAMFNQGSHLIISNSVFWGDYYEIGDISSSSVTIKDSVVQGAAAGSDCLSDPQVTCTNVLHTDPHLGPLQNNTGFTQTMALGAGSSAIDAGGVNAPCASTDQRGVSRPQGGACDMGAYEVHALSYKSVGANDGWLLEAGQNGNVGGSLDSASPTIRLGDDNLNQQYRGLLSFNTASLPDGAAVVLGKLKVKQQSMTGKPFTGHGTLLIDLKKPFFGSILGLEVSDFQAGATTSKAGQLGSAAVGGWYSGLLSAAGAAHINKLGTTELRLRFSIGDDHDQAADYLSIFSGNAPAASRPVLVVYYNP